MSTITTKDGTRLEQLNADLLGLLKT